MMNILWKDRPVFIYKYQDKHEVFMTKKKSWKKIVVSYDTQINTWVQQFSEDKFLLETKFVERVLICVINFIFLSDV